MERIRISCACLGRIILNDKYLLIQNKKMRSKGELSYGPIGGALEYKKEAHNFLVSIGVEFEKGLDLRFSIPKDNYSKFKEWFNSNKNRESTIFRELKEEIVDEEKIVDEIDEPEIFETIVSNIETTQDWKIGDEIKTSYYFFQIHEVKFSQSLEEKLLKNMENDDKIKLFSLKEIETLNIITGSVKYILK